MNDRTLESEDALELAAAASKFLEVYAKARKQNTFMVWQEADRLATKVEMECGKILSEDRKLF